MVWNYMKRIGTARKPLAKSLHDRIDVELQQIQENRALVRSFLRAQSVSYIRDSHKILGTPTKEHLLIIARMQFLRLHRVLIRMRTVLTPRWIV